MSARKPKRKSQPRSSAAASAGGPSPGSPSAGSPMDVALLERMVKLMAANDLNTVDVRDGDQRVILKRGAAFVSMPPVSSAAAPSPPPGLPSSAAPTAPAAAEDASKGLLPIKSPMVGTFYSSAKPGEKPFVTVGSVVNDETDVCIIEAMKTFNVHKAGVSGTIAKVLVQDGQTVQFDQAMFLVKPA